MILGNLRRKIASTGIESSSIFPVDPRPNIPHDTKNHGSFIYMNYVYQSELIFVNNLGNN